MTISKWTVITASAVVVVLIAGAVVLASMVTSSGTTQMGQPGRLMQMERSGEMHQMLQQHQDMLDRMRSDASPQMQRQMEDDPMTRMMFSGDMIRMQEQHQAEIDKMLGRGSNR